MNTSSYCIKITKRLRIPVKFKDCCKWPSSSLRQLDTFTCTSDPNYSCQQRPRHLFCYKILPYFVFIPQSSSFYLPSYDVTSEWNMLLLNSLNSKISWLTVKNHRLLRLKKIVPIPWTHAMPSASSITSKPPWEGRTHFTKYSHKSTFTLQK